MLIAVDLDGILCEEGERNWENYSSVIPILDNIARVNELFEKHTIIIYTSRYQEDERVTRDWLYKWGVKHHRLVLGKLPADLYIDDRAINSVHEVEE